MARKTDKTRKAIHAKRRSGNLTHVNQAGQAHMVDVAEKPESLRVAVASAQLRMSRKTLNAIQANTGAKGDALAVARVAALGGLKQTANLIPLCHPVRIVASDVDVEVLPKLPGIQIRVRVTAFDRTGVEMEAMAGAAIAALTVYDMIKGLERGVTIEQVRLEEKAGGRSGLWRRAP